MKYIKLYENLDKENEYEIDDYVHLDDSGEEWKVYLDVKIIKFIDKNHHDEFRVEAQRKDSNQIVGFWVDLGEIKRKSTIEEIEEYELRKNTIKYNI